MTAAVPTLPRGVILAGGAGSRMGSDKALVEVDGIPMVRRVGSVLEQVAAGGLHVQGRRGTLAGYPCRPDTVSGGGGPLRGLVSALEVLPEGVPLILVAVDHPYVRGETLRGMVTRFEHLPAVVPIADGVRQVTVAVYGRGVLEAAHEELARGGSLQTLLDGIEFDTVHEEEWRNWHEDGRSWFSVDSPADVTEGLRRYAT